MSKEIIRINKAKLTFWTALIAVLILCAIACIALCNVCVAEEISADTEQVEDSGAGAWIREHWQTIVQAFAGVSGVAAVSAMIGVITQIVKFIKVCKSGNASTDELKKAYNAMVDEVSALKAAITETLKDESTALGTLASANKSNADKQAALLGVVQRLIDMSEMPQETKTSLTGIINGGNGNEQTQER